VADYERRTTLFPGWRERLIGWLAPRPGDTVLDVGCGPGLNFSALRSRVGPRGRIIGVEESAELLEVAADRVRARGWRNIELIHAPPGTDAAIPGKADAALSCAAPNLLHAPARLAPLLSAVRPGAPVAAGGWAWPADWLWPLRRWLTAWYGPLLHDPIALNQPWRSLAEHLAQPRVTRLMFGTAYLATGRTRDDATSSIRGGSPPGEPAMTPRVQCEEARRRANP
jgi:demethylmenaquinone methyltransferase/2-methoxy-6-polyprenyl-1,4-benzoquinol methylase